MSIRLLLFDLDGTLLHARDGMVAFRRALCEVFGVTFPGGQLRTDGMTDQAIVKEMLFRAGSPKVPTAREMKILEETHGQLLQAAIDSGEIVVEAKYGAEKVLRSLRDSGRYRLAVVTGNFAKAAAVKLGAAGLADHFDIGAYGSDHFDRAKIAALGRQRAEACWKEQIPVERCVIVGDTIRDLGAARANGMLAMLVATGRASYDELAPLGAEILIEDWRDDKLVLEELARLLS